MLLVRASQLTGRIVSGPEPNAAVTVTDKDSTSMPLIYILISTYTQTRTYVLYAH